MPLSRQDHEPGVGNALGEHLRSLSVGHVAHHRVVVLSHQHQRGHGDVLEPVAGVVLLPRDHVPEVALYRGQVGHAHLQEPLDLGRVLLRVRLGPAHLDGVVPHVFLVAHLHHLGGDPEGYAAGAGVGRPGRGEYELVHPPGVLQRQQLRHPAAHGMAAHHGPGGVQVVHDRGHVVGEHARGVAHGGPGGPSGAPEVRDDGAVVPGELGRLEQVPHVSVARGLRDEDERPSVPVDLVVDVGVADVQRWHDVLPNPSRNA